MSTVSAITAFETRKCMLVNVTTDVMLEVLTLKSLQFTPTYGNVEFYRK